MDIYQKYFQLQNQIKTLEEQRDQLMVELLDDLDDKHTKEFGTDFASFTVVERTTYEYSESTQMAEEQLKRMKRKDIELGLAFIKTNSRHVRMDKPKI